MKLVGKAAPTKTLSSREIGYLKPIVPGIVDLGSLKGGFGHLTCPGCDSPWFEVDVNGCFIQVGCKKCHFETKAMMPNQFDQQGLLRCPDCKGDNTGMALIVADDTICVGCKKCRWQLRSLLTEPENKLIV